MNCRLLLLLVAVLYTSGCVYAVQITTEDAKKAIELALKEFDAANKDYPNPSWNLDLDSYTWTPITLKNVEGKMKRKISHQHFNCGLIPKGIFVLPEKRIKEVRNWFKNQNQLVNKKVKEQQWKNNGCFVNLLGNKENNQLRFNYHLQVDVPKRNC